MLLRIIILLIFLNVGAVDSVNAEALTLEQELFQQTEQAIKKKNWPLYQKNIKQLSNYPLVSYLHRDKLLSHFNKNNIQPIETFLNKNNDQVVSRKLRFKWLKWLARNRQEQLFLKHYRDFGDKTLRCNQLHFRLNSSEPETDVYARVNQLWHTPRSLPKACDPVISAWKKAGKLSPGLIWKRMLLATNARQTQLAKYLNRQLPEAQQEVGQLLIRVARNPEQLTSVRFRSPLTEYAKDIILLGLTKLAWRDPHKSTTIWKTLGLKHPSISDLPELRRTIALSLAINKSPKATEWLLSIDKNDDKSVSHWLFSSVLNQQDWPAVDLLTKEFSEQEPDRDKWIYWRGIAGSRMANNTLAQQLFSSIADNRSYYGFLAAKQLNRQPNLQNQPITLDQSEQALLEQQPALIRAKEFLALGRINEARREWNKQVSLTPFNQQVKLALLAHQWGWQHQAILGFARSKQVNDISKRFPLHKFQSFTENSEQNQIPVSWAYAITRQESAFKVDALSSAGARGLMQLTHATAKMIARNRLRYRRPSQLLNAETNIKLGTAYLGKIYKRFDAHPVLATAAYNAGAHKVQQWIKESNTDDTIQWIEQIPYMETREYVKNVLTYQLIYAELTQQTDSFIANIEHYPITTNTAGASTTGSR